MDFATELKMATGWMWRQRCVFALWNCAGNSYVWEQEDNNLILTQPFNPDTRYRDLALFDDCVSINHVTNYIQLAYVTVEREQVLHESTTRLRIH